jgi:hypothetical protein
MLCWRTLAGFCTAATSQLCRGPIAWAHAYQHAVCQWVRPMHRRHQQTTNVHPDMLRLRYAIGQPARRVGRLRRPRHRCPSSAMQSRAGMHVCSSNSDSMTITPLHMMDHSFAHQQQQQQQQQRHVNNTHFDDSGHLWYGALTVRLEGITGCQSSAAGCRPDKQSTGAHAAAGWPCNSSVGQLHSDDGMAMHSFGMQRLVAGVAPA